jgi:hypothetical protein
VIAAVAALGQGVARRLPLEVDAGDVVEEQIVLQGEEFPQARDQVLFQRRLLRQQAIEGAVEAVVVDQRRGQGKQVLEGGPAVPVLRDMELARGFTQTGQDQHGGHRRPGHGFAALGQQPLEQLVQPQRAPEGPAKPDVAEGAAALEPDPVQADRDDVRGVVGWGEEIRLLQLSGDRARQGSGTGSAVRVEFSQVGDGLLDDAPADADGTNQLPVGVDFAVLAPRRVTQIHCSAYPTGRPPKSMNLVATTRPPRELALDRDWTYERRDQPDRAVRLLELRKLG